MSAFIVISTIDHLKGLVEGMETALPLNPCVNTCLSTGKIEKHGEDFVYSYKIFNEETRDNGEQKPLSDMVKNQLASFRLACNIGGDNINIFLLENPTTHEELVQLNHWLEEINKVYKNDNNIHLYRFLFSYDMSQPHDVSKQIPAEVIKQYLEERKNYDFYNNSTTIYVDNENCHAAAICLGKDDHDFKMPRMILDFMMLISSSNSTYNISNAITPPNQTSQNCVSYGYAESMYYYPDVLEYFRLADERDAYKHCIECEELLDDNTDDADMLSSFAHPLGLKARIKRLHKYEEIALDKDIADQKNTADSIIDENLCALKDAVNKKRQQELDEINEKFITGEILELTEPQCPEFISRKEIFDKIQGLTTAKEKEEETEKYTEKYNELINYVRSNDFFDYVKTLEEENEHKSQEAAEQVKEYNGEQNKGCLFFWWPWGNNTQTDTSIEPQTVEEPKVSLQDNVRNIRNQLELKNRYAGFKKEIKSIEGKLKASEEKCKAFKLRNHSHQVELLIDLDELKTKQQAGFSQRMQTAIDSWNKVNQEDKNLDALLHEIKVCAEKHAEQYKFIDWATPFSFVKTVDANTLSEMCKRLTIKAAPFVNINIQSGNEHDGINCMLYSDNSKIKDLFEVAKSNINNSNAIAVYHSTHTASKICMMQILPLTEEIINNLVDLKQSI